MGERLKLEHTRLSGALLVGLAVAGAPATVAANTGPVSWGEPVMIARGAWGRMTPSARGDWLCVVTRFATNRPSGLTIHQSTDGCRTWTMLSEVQEPGRMLDNGNLWLLPDHTLLLTGRSLIEGQSYRLPVYHSIDAGRSWARLSNIDANEGAPGTLPNRGLWEPHLFLLASGKLSVIYSNEKHAGYSQILSQRVSPDQGAHWGDEIRIVEQPDGGSLRPGMGVPARMANGEFILVYEVVGIGNGDVHFKVSDNGVDWPGGLGTRIDGQHCGPFVISLADGRLLVTSCENQLELSEDFGLSWQPVKPPAWDLGFKFSWPSIYELGTNRLAVLATSGDVKMRLGVLAPRVGAVGAN
jgi:hypothetical protein